jgi:hypothetical protein
MNSINHNVSIGAPHSLARYKRADRICADCLRDTPESLAVVAISGMHSGDCYVCEQRRSVVNVKITEI